jgi:metal-responsive CopG/Arc/MetJ family transcriptional regulator
MVVNKQIRTTILIPAELLDAIDRIASDGRVKSRNEFVTQALQRELTRQKRQEIDVTLSEMIQDPEYQATVKQMDEEFAVASWDALRMKNKNDT